MVVVHLFVKIAEIKVKQTFQMRLALLIDLHLLRVWSTGTNPKETDHWSIDFVEW